MTEHPWMRAPALANMIGLMLGALAVIIASLNIEILWLKLVLVFVGTIALMLFLLLFLSFLCLVIRDYKKLYSGFTREIFGIRY